MTEEKNTKPEKEGKKAEDTPSKDGSLAKANDAPIKDPKAKEKKDKGGTAEEVLFGEALDNMPPEMQRTLRSFIGMFSRTTSTGGNSLVEKFTDAHVDKYLDNLEKDSEREYKLKSSNRWFTVIFVLIGAIVLAGGVIYLLPNNVTIFTELIKIIAIFGGGIGVGIGIGKRKQ